MSKEANGQTYWASVNMQAILLVPNISSIMQKSIFISSRPAEALPVDETCTDTWSYCSLTDTNDGWYGGVQKQFC